MKKTVILTTGIYPTQGVFTLIKYFAYSLITNTDFNKKYDLKILVFHESLIMKTKKFLYNFYLILKNIFLNEKNRIHNYSYSSKEFIKENYTIKDRVYLFSNQKEYDYYNPEIILPNLTFFKNKIFKSIGYIYDLQHKDIPKYFSQKEKRRRNLEFFNIIKYNEKFFVNSNFVKLGVLKNFNTTKNDIFKIPFLPYIIDEVKNLNIDLKQKYGIYQNYFIICNRFWKHKNHDIVFEAFSKFIISKKNYQLVCTGDISDTRDPNYFVHLHKKYRTLITKQKIKILGLISRNDQLNLLNNANAVIQPTLYEGGPGGFASYEAIAFQKPLILSNIPINREIKYKKAKFFNPKSSKSLLIELNKICLKSKNNLSMKILKKKSNSNKIQLGKFLFKSIELTIKSSK